MAHKMIEAVEIVSAKEIVLTVTGKPIITTLNAGFSVISETQAKKLCAGKLPKPGYETLMYFNDGKPKPCHYSDRDYIIGRTQHNRETVWAIYGVKFKWVFPL